MRVVKFQSVTGCKGERKACDLHFQSRLACDVKFLKNSAWLCCDFVWAAQGSHNSLFAPPPLPIMWIEGCPPLDQEFLVCTKSLWKCPVGCDSAPVWVNVHISSQLPRQIKMWDKSCSTNTHGGEVAHTFCCFWIVCISKVCAHQWQTAFLFPLECGHCFDAVERRARFVVQRTETNRTNRGGWKHATCVYFIRCSLIKLRKILLEDFESAWMVEKRELRKAKKPNTDDSKIVAISIPFESWGSQKPKTHKKAPSVDKHRRKDQKEKKVRTVHMVLYAFNWDRSCYCFKSCTNILIRMYYVDTSWATIFQKRKRKQSCRSFRLPPYYFKFGFQLHALFLCFLNGTWNPVRILLKKWANACFRSCSTFFS